MSSCIVKIGRGGLFGSNPLDIVSPPEAAPFMGNAFLPRLAVIPLKQHLGRIARPVVLPGAVVQEGQVIAVPQGKNSAYVHSSVPGILRGYRDGKDAVIELSGEFVLSGRRPEARNLGNASASSLLSMIEKQGILRTFDGSCAPLSSLLHLFKEQFSSSSSAMTAGILALRMHDFDPSCCTDSFIIKNYTGAVLEGCALVAKSLEVKRICLLYQDQDKKAIALDKLIEHNAFEGFEVKQTSLSSVYPSGADYICKCAAAKAFGKSHPESVFCINPWTAFSVFNALKYEIPVLQRPVLVAGSAIRNPQILNVRIGTMIKDIVAQCGGFKFEPAKAVVGGLVAGRALDNLDVPVDINTDALHFFGKHERHFFTAERCTHCGRCLRICPSRLDPARLALAPQKTKAAAALKCIFCGACSAVCPAGIPLHHIINGTLNSSVASISSNEDAMGGKHWN